MYEVLIIIIDKDEVIPLDKAVVYLTWAGTWEIYIPGPNGRRGVNAEAGTLANALLHIAAWIDLDMATPP